MDLDLTATCIVGCFRGVVQSLVAESDAPVDADAVARGVLDFALRGVATPSA